MEFRPTAAVQRRHAVVPPVLEGRLIRYHRTGFRPAWVLTSLLDGDAFPRAEVIKLYHRRWQIETIYREWKHGLDIQNLRSRTPTGVVKEICAHLLLSNLVRWVMTEATENTELRAVDLSYVSALNHVKNAVLQMLRADAGRISVIYSHLLHDVRSTRIRRRPGRSYPRCSVRLTAGRDDRRGPSARSGYT